MGGWWLVDAGRGMGVGGVGVVDALMGRPHTRTGSHIERGQSTETINQYNVPHTPTSTSTTTSDYP